MQHAQIRDTGAFYPGICQGADRFAGRPGTGSAGMVEAAGGKLLSFYFTTGDTDFLLITEGEGEDVVAGILAAGAAGTIAEMSTARAWTGAEFKAIAEKSGRVASAYRAPG